MNMLSFYTFVATLGPVGYLTAPGTIASIVTIPGMFWLRMLFPSQQAYGGIVIIFLIASLYIVHRARTYFKRHEDPPEIVIDEVVGLLITFLAIPLCTSSVVVGFLLFRFFDIFKIGGIRYVERLNGSWGIVLDDVVAALISNIILRLIF